MYNKSGLKMASKSLANNTSLRYLIFIALYFAQGIPEGITLFAIPAWMAANNKTTEEIAAYTAIGLIPFSFKIFLAPIMERYVYLPMGRRRPWLLFGQTGILLSLIALSFIPNPLNNIQGLTSAVLCLHIFILFQDIATDSLVIDIVPVEQQGKANSFMWGSKTAGTALSLFIGSWLINNYGFSNTLLYMSVPILFILFIPLLTREREGEKLLPWTKGQVASDAAKLTVDSWLKLFNAFKQMVVLKDVMLLISIGFCLFATLNFVRTMLPIFSIQEIGWSNLYYSKIYATSGLIGGLAGMTIGAVIIQRYGCIKLIQIAASLMVLLAIAMALFESMWIYDTVICTFIGIFCTLYTLINIGALALAMKLCWKRISALQFTLCMTAFNFGLSAGAAMLGLLRTYYHWQTLFFIFAGMISCLALFLNLINTQRHQQKVNQLENNYTFVHLNN